MVNLKILEINCSDFVIMHSRSDSVQAVTDVCWIDYLLPYIYKQLCLVTVHGMNSFKIATKKSAKTRAKYTQL